jgi:hypothetical protein
VIIVTAEVHEIPGVAHRRQFKNLSEQEVLALAISSEEDDGRIYRWYAQRLRAGYPQSARVFDEMAIEEDEHRASLVEEHRRRFGDAIPLIRREHVAGFYNRRPVWLIQNLGPDRIREEAARIDSRRVFYGARRRNDRCRHAPAAQSARGRRPGPRIHVAAPPPRHLPPSYASLRMPGHRQFALMGAAGTAGRWMAPSHARAVFAAAFATGDTTDLPRRPRRIGRRRHLDGVHRSGVG